MTNLILCQRCETLQKNGITRRDVFFKDGEYCIQCRAERIKDYPKKQKILNENLLKTLQDIKKRFGGKK